MRSMRFKLSTCTLLVLAGALVAAPAHALRCGSRLVSNGDTLAEVKHLCGEPTQVDTREEPVTFGAVDRQTGLYVERTVERSVTVVTYNFGPRRLMQELRFRDGKLIDIRNLGFGY